MKSVEMFNQQLTGMGEVFNKAITPALAQIYWTSLKEFTDEQVKTISLEDIKQSAAKYFNMSNYVRVTLFPEEWMKE